MAPVARELAAAHGVLEPLQTASSLEGQIDELRAVLELHGSLPVTLVGFSWGAWLSFMIAARYPELVKKLVLIGSGSFEKQDAADTLTTRLQRLDVGDQEEVRSLLALFDDPESGASNDDFKRLGALLAPADAYDPEISETAAIDHRLDIFRGVWKSAADLRRSGRLLELGKRIMCPVAAIHGDYDSHPAEGVQKPLSSVVERFRFILLEKCGHKPWIERQAKETFFEILTEELS